MPAKDRAALSNTSLDVWVMRRPLVKLPKEAEGINLKIEDPLALLNNYMSITEVEEEYQAFAAYQMVYERFYTDTEEATAKFRAFQQTMRECKGLTQRAKTPIAIGITEEADKEGSERRKPFKLAREAAQQSVISGNSA